MDTPENNKARRPRHAAPEPAKAVTPAQRRVQVAAARLRVTLDDRLGRTTPPDVKALAQKAL
jgi:hypothetical protein